jgi:hypothetical protein
MECCPNCDAFGTGGSEHPQIRVAHYLVGGFGGPLPHIRVAHSVAHYLNTYYLVHVLVAKPRSSLDRGPCILYYVNGQFCIQFVCSDRDFDILSDCRVIRSVQQ